MSRLHKYPRTPHVEGSRLGPGDEDQDAVPLRHLRDKHLVVEEKIDGANAGISFSPDGEVQLQSRGHFLTGGPRERHFDLFKQWGHGVADALRPVIGSRYVVYGEWLYAKHTIFYDKLPAYFLEFDVLDSVENRFLSTCARRKLLYGLPLASVPVLREGKVDSLRTLKGMIAASAYISENHLNRLQESCRRRHLDVERVLAETDPSRTMEGLYIKVETPEAVVGRFKYIRASFLTTVVQSDTHWLNRPMVPNQLRSDALMTMGAS